MRWSWVLTACRAAPVLTFLVVASCASGDSSRATFGPSHPASPNARAGLVHEVASRLSPPADEEERSGSSHDASEHSGHGEAQVPAEQAAEAPYVCPMHPEITSAQPAKCSICGMALRERPKEQSSAEHPHGR